MVREKYKGRRRQVVQVAACHRWGGCIRCPMGAQILSSAGDKPHTGCYKMFPTRVVVCLHQQKLITGQIRNSGKALLRPLLQQGGARTNSSFSCLLSEKPPVFITISIQSLPQLLAAGGRERTKGSVALIRYGSGPSSIMLPTHLRVLGICISRKILQNNPRTMNQLRKGEPLITLQQLHTIRDENNNETALTELKQTKQDERTQHCQDTQYNHDKIIKA